MAKDQQRSNRKMRKPKADKKKPPAAQTSPYSPPPSRRPSPRAPLPRRAGRHDRHIHGFCPACFWTGFLWFSNSIAMCEPLLICRARCAASNTSSNLFGTLSTQSSTVTRAHAAALVATVQFGERLLLSHDGPGNSKRLRLRASPPKRIQRTTRVAFAVKAVAPNL